MTFETGLGLPKCPVDDSSMVVVPPGHLPVWECPQCGLRAVAEWRYTLSDRNRSRQPVLFTPQAGGPVLVQDGEDEVDLSEDWPRAYAAARRHFGEQP